MPALLFLFTPFLVIFLQIMDLVLKLLATVSDIFIQIG